MIRLDKYLADMGAGTRQEVKKYIRQGKVYVDGSKVTKPEFKVEPNEQEVSLDGDKICYEEFEYYMLYKPAGYVSATQDKKEKTVLELIKEKKRKDLFPAGRLDKDTEGLLLITNDGELAHRLLSPRKHVDKVYYAKIQGMVDERDIRIFAEGMDIGEGERAKPSRLCILSSGEISEIELTIQEGKYHQVKRMLESVGKKVLYLKRLSMGSLWLDKSLKPGEYRKLTNEELKELC